MIRLKDILLEINEITFMSGKSSGDDSEGMGNDALNLIYSDEDRIPKVVEDLWEDGDSPEDAKKLLSLIQKKTPIIFKKGKYALIKQDTPRSIHFYLIDTIVYNPKQMFVATAKMDMNDVGYEYNLKKLFGTDVYQVHWSNVAEEYQGQGIGKILYTLLYEFCKSKNAAIISDDILYEGSSAMWRKYMPQIAKYFGILMSDIILPITAEDVKDTRFDDTASASGFVAMERPTKMMRKIAHNVQGLSFSRGDYGVVKMFNGINDPIEKANSSKQERYYFDNLVDEVDTIQKLINSVWYEKAGVYSATGKIKTCAIFAFEDAVAIVKQVGNRLVTVYL